jgi:hypothetical protein
MWDKRALDIVDAKLNYSTDLGNHYRGSSKKQK